MQLWSFDKLNPNIPIKITVVSGSTPPTQHLVLPHEIISFAVKKLSTYVHWNVSVKQIYSSPKERIYALYNIEPTREKKTDKNKWVYKIKSKSPEGDTDIRKCFGYHGYRISFSNLQGQPEFDRHNPMPKLGDRDLFTPLVVLGEAILCREIKQPNSLWVFADFGVEDLKRFK